MACDSGGMPRRPSERVAHGVVERVLQIVARMLGMERRLHEDPAYK